MQNANQTPIQKANLEATEEANQALREMNATHVESGHLKQVRNRVLSAIRVVETVRSLDYGKLTEQEVAEASNTIDWCLHVAIQLKTAARREEARECSNEAARLARATEASILSNDDQQARHNAEIAKHMAQRAWGATLLIDADDEVDDEIQALAQAAKAAAQRAARMAGLE